MTMSIVEVDEIVIEQGKTFKWWIAVERTDGSVADLVADGYSIVRFVVAPTYGEDPVIDVNQTNYIHVERVFDGPINDHDRMQWSGYIEIPASGPGGTASLQPWGRGIYEITVSNIAGDTMCVDRGTAVLELGVAL